jgi:hypothetical protein
VEGKVNSLALCFLWRFKPRARVTRIKWLGFGPLVVEDPTISVSKNTENEQTILSG